jgi:hypothetical protein
LRLGSRILRVVSIPLAYFITFSCFGRWLHGGERGSVDEFNNVVAEERLQPSPSREMDDGERLRWPPMSLDADQREAVDDAVREVCTYRGWTLHALNVRTNHVHVVVAATLPIERVMTDLKRYSTRKLATRALIEAGRHPWASHGSTRYV